MVLSGVLGGFPGLSTQAQANAAEGTAYRNVAYYASWAGYARNFPLTDMDFSKITHLNFAFANLNADGSVVVGDEWIDTQITSGVYGDMGFNWEDAEAGMAGHFGALKKIKAQYPDLKTLISVGGWTWSTNFSDVAADPAKRAKMAQTSVDFVVKYGFDGVDLDWEYPVEGGNNIKHRAEDKQNYTLLVKAIREALDAQGAKDGKDYLLTIAGGANPTFAKNTELKEMMKYLDWINIMTYDYHGAFDAKTNFNAPLYLDPADNTGTDFSIDASIKSYLDAGVNPKDINLGLAFYGRGWVNVNANGADSLYTAGSSTSSYGMDMGSWEGCCWDYWDIKENYIGQRGYVRYWNDVAKVPYLYSTQTKTFITYDDEESINIKLDYLMNKGLGGAMYWEASGDKYNDLLGVVATRLGIENGQIVPPTGGDTEEGGNQGGNEGGNTEEGGNQGGNEGGNTDDGNQGGNTDDDKDDEVVTPDPSVPTWDSSAVYVGGDEVVYNGVQYRAKWWTQGDNPETQGPWGPWEVVGTSSEGGNQGGNEGGNTEEDGNQGGNEGGNTEEGGNQGGNEGGNTEEGGNQGGNEGGNTGDDGNTDEDDKDDETGNVGDTGNQDENTGLAKHVVTGYWQNFDNGAKCLKISDVPEAYNLIAVAFAESTSTPGEVVFNLDPTLAKNLGGYTKQQFIDDIAAAKEKGQRVIISVGGEKGNVIISNQAQAELFADSVYALMQEYGFDGVDIDLEHGINAQYLEVALRRLYDKVGASLIIAMAPQTIDMQSVNTEYFKLALNIKDILTIVNMQYYNSGSMLGQDQMVYSQGSVDFLTALAAIQLENGLRPDQVGIGVPASVKGAGSGYVDPSIVNQALNCLAKGEAGGRYKPVRTYEGLRGAMTWSINWDASNGYNFINTVAPVVMNLSDPSSSVVVPPATGGDEGGNEGGDQGGTVTPDPSNTTWDSSAVYVGGDEVIYNGVRYRAKWWTQGDNPETQGPWGPWQAI